VGTGIIIKTATFESIKLNAKSPTIAVKLLVDAIFTKQAMLNCTCDGSAKSSGKTRNALYPYGTKVLFGK
jgi:hypothetical protein